MSISFTHHTTAKSGTVFGTGPYAPAAFTVAAGALLLARVHAFSYADFGIPAALALSDSQTLTWSPQLTNSHSGSDWYGSKLFTAVCPAGGSISLTADCSTLDVDQYAIELISISGYHASPIGATGQAYDGDGDFAGALTLGAAPAVDSYVFAFVDERCDAATAYSATVGSGWNEMDDQLLTANQTGIQSQYRTGSTSTSVVWGDLFTGTGTPVEALLCAIEIKAAAGFAGRRVSKTGRLNSRVGGGLA